MDKNYENFIQFIGLCNSTNKNIVQYVH